MRYLRFEKDGNIAYGLWQEDGIHPLTASPFDTHHVLPEVVELADIHLLAPVTPPHVYAIGLNYRKHIEEFRHIDTTRDLPEAPIAFMCAPSAIIGPREPIHLQNDVDKIDYEAELVAVIGKRCQGVSEAEALDYVFGYTCGNDVSNSVHQNMDKQWLRAKSQPTYKPLGPWIETDLNPVGLNVTSTLNGDLRQQGNSSDMIFSVAALIAHISAFTPLVPGDVIYTGTPEGVGPLKAGDTIDIFVEGVGTLTNPVILK